MVKNCTIWKCQNYYLCTVFDELSSTLNLKFPSTFLYHFVINNLFITILLFFLNFIIYKIVIFYEIPENTYKQ